MARRVTADYRWRGANDLWSYPWKTWFDGNIWQLDRGTDYHEPTERFRRRAYYVSQRWGMILRTQKLFPGEGLIVCAKRPSEADDAFFAPKWDQAP